MDAIYGRDHPYTIAPMRSVAGLADDAMRCSESLELYREIFARSKVIYGERSSDTAAVLILIADVETKLGRYAEARQSLQRSIDIARQVMGADHLVTIVGELSLGKHIVRYGNAADAEPILAAAVARLSRKVREDSPMLLEPRVFLARAQYASGDREAGLATARDAYEKAIANGRPGDARAMALISSVYGPMLAGDGDYDAAEPILRATLERLAANQQADTPQMRAILQALHEICQATGRADEAQQFATRAAALESSTSLSLRRDVTLRD
jgi:tetratricopeptide (TPR) repeat protein